MYIIHAIIKAALYIETSVILRGRSFGNGRTVINQIYNSPGGSKEELYWPFIRFENYENEKNGMNEKKHARTAAAITAATVAVI